MMKRFLDLFCGRWGWSKSFAARGWECVGVDLVEPPTTPKDCIFVQFDILNLRIGYQPLNRPYFTTRGSLPNPLWQWTDFDFACASPPCEEFSVWGMKHFHPHPKYPENGIKLFNHTREILEASGVPYVMENVRAAQQFVGNAVHHCGPFYLWGNAVPPLMHRGITKGTHDVPGIPINRSRHYYRMTGFDGWQHGSKSENRRQARAAIATIPPELANCVADYAERLLELKGVLLFKFHE